MMGPKSFISIFTLIFKRKRLKTLVALPQLRAPSSAVWIPWWSGSRTTSRGISKRGDRYLRKALYIALAMIANRNNPVTRFYDEHRDRLRGKKMVIACTRKLARCGAWATTTGPSRSGRGRDVPLSWVVRAMHDFQVERFIRIVLS
ncbi:MAG: hypothetical protein MjAS7_0168 [Metallosphaera javensis (ex Sakai et al. 2022)]|nr:MAG: hypothetical protein MjAS7_0168 [Metallosphaera javensis (ex Sakai et al. 2022)]